MRIKAYLRDYLVLLLLIIVDHKKEVILLACTFIINTVFTLVILSGVDNKLEARAPGQQGNVNVFSQDMKLQKARLAYKHFRDMDKRALQISFFDIAGEWTYQRGGSNQYKMGDCVGAVDAVFSHYGSFLPREDVGQRLRRLERLRTIGATFKCYGAYGITAPKMGDMIFIQTSPGDPSHEAIVYDISNGYIRYLEMGGVALTANLTTIPLGDARIHSIYSLTIEVWLGE